MATSTIERMFAMSERTWARHANPWSFHTRLPILPLAALAIYLRPLLGWWCLVPLAALAAWMFINPRAFPPPARLDAYPSRAVLGERIFLARRTRPIPAHQARAATVLSLVSLCGLPFLVYGLVVLDPFATLLGLAVTMGGKLWFLDRMVWLHDEMQHGAVHPAMNLVTDPS